MMPRRRTARFPVVPRAIAWWWAGCWIFLLLPAVPREAAAFPVGGGATPGAFMPAGPQFQHRQASYLRPPLPPSPPSIISPLSSATGCWSRRPGSSSFRHRSSSRSSVPPLHLSSSSSSTEEAHRHSEDDNEASGSTAASSDSHNNAPADDNNDDTINPYADPNYPDLEFVNYADPEYSADRGLGDDFDDGDYYNDRSNNDNTAETEAEIERMREERRIQNDEYQFQTYFASILHGGDTYKGEWTVYKSSSFLPNVSPDPNGLPRLVKAAKPLKVVSRAFKVASEGGSSARGGEDERIVHEEVLADPNDRDPYKSWQDDVDVDRGFGSHDRYDDDEGKAELDNNNDEVEEAIASEVLLPYWPEKLQQLDFRGPQGIMCVGNAYTIATAVPLYDDEIDAATKGAAVGVPLDPTAPPATTPTTTTPTGPYREYRAELGIQSKALRFRIKLNYAVPTTSTSASSAAVPEDSVPPLVLKTLVVCREARGLWPRPGKRRSVADKWSEDGLYGPPGAPGGLYDPPPIDAAQATQYLLLDLDGRATALFPYQMDQSPDAFGGTGWVASLDWTPDSMRFQVDRKVHGGAGILGLKTLELSEVQSQDADRYRPRDGGRNMRQ